MSNWHHFSVTNQPGYFGHETTVRNIVISADQRYLLSNCQLSFKIWNLQSGELIKSYNYSPYQKTGGLAFTPDGRFAVVGHESDFDLINLEDWSIRSITNTYGSLSVQEIAITPDNRYVIIGNDTLDSSLCIYDLFSFQIVGKLAGHGTRQPKLSPEWMNVGWAKRIYATQDDQYVISGALDNIKVWDFKKRNEIQHLQDTSEIQVLALTSDDRYVLSINTDNEIKIWDWRSGKSKTVITNAHKHRVEDIAVTPDTQRAITCSLGGSAKVWELPTGKLEYVFPHDEFPVNRISMASDGRWAIFAMGTDIRVWHL